MQTRAHIFEAILCGMKLGATKPVNFSKVKGVIQKQEENPKAFYDRLEKAFRKYTILDPESVVGLNHHFLNQLASCIRLQKLNLQSLTKKTHLVDTVLQVYSHCDLEVERREQSKEKMQVKHITAAIGDTPNAQRHPQTKRLESYPASSSRSRGTWQGVSQSHPRTLS
jgi:hypothetical protein